MNTSPFVALQRSHGLYPGVSPAFRSRFRGLGSTAINEGVTGVKAGVAASGISTAIGTSVAGAIGAGAAAGSVVPIIGTAIGALVGLFASGVLNHKADPEVANFNQAVAIFHQNPQSVLNIANKYLVLAGLFDLLPGQIKGNIPIYKKYGRMGEFRFVTDMCNLIYQAAQQGQITANDTPTTVFNRIVQPWIDSWGFGPMQDSNGEMITLIIMGMVAEYLAGAQSRWYAVKGDYPFSTLRPFGLPIATATAPTTSGTPVPVSSTPIPFASGGSAPAQPVGSAVPVPAGFSVVGTGNNLPVYQGPDGAYYTWSGTTLSPLNGTLFLASGGSLLVSAGYPQQQPGSLYPPGTAAPQVPQYQSPLASNTQAGVSPYASALPAYAPSPYPQPMAAAQTPTGAITAGISQGGWIGLAGVGAVLLFMFATARPLRGGGYPRGAARPLRGARPRRSR